MRRVLAIDPGSRRIGYAVLENGRGRLRLLAQGSVRVAARGVAEPLRRVHDAVDGLIRRHRPREFVIERAFAGRNVRSALRLSEARSAAIVAAARRRIEVFEYGASEARCAAFGSGAATKSMVRRAVTARLGLAREPDADAADAIALALCHSGRCWGIDAWAATP